MSHLAIFFLGAIFLSLSATGAKNAEKEQNELAPGWTKLQFGVPQAGAYDLPVVKTLRSNAVLLESGETSDLHSLYKDKVTVLSFIYTRCSDVNGCPLASFVLRNFSKSMDPETSRKTRLISLSFDPSHDTPEVMKEYGDLHRPNESSDWLFLTTADSKSLKRIVDDFGVWVGKEYNENGKETGAYAHLLRVYLIDSENRIRNIYSPDFLHQDILEADVKTVLLES